MYGNSRKLFLWWSALLGTASVMVLGAVSLLYVAGGSSAVAADTSLQQITDARLESQILTTYALNSYLRATELNASVSDGKATLGGLVEDEVSRELAKQIALGVSGITDVDNQIVVQADYAAAARSSERSYGDRIDDATTSAMVKSKLLWSQHTSGLATGVDTQLGTVTLTGKADTTLARELAGTLAANTRGVVAVDNQLSIRDQTAAIASDKADGPDANVVSDAWISTKVKSTFIYSSNVDGGAIDVSTRDGVVSLVGTLRSSAERELAIQLAKNIRGVKSVESKLLAI